jgi:hypothetical protein
MMTQLRQRMLEEHQRRNYCSGAIRLYLQHVAKFAQHFHRSPDQLGAEDIRQYQLFLIQEKKLAWSSYNQIVWCAALFLYQGFATDAPVDGHSLSTESPAPSSYPQSGGGGRNPHRTPHFKSRALLMTMNSVPSKTRSAGVPPITISARFSLSRSHHLRLRSNTHIPHTIQNT